MKSMRMVFCDRQHGLLGGCSRTVGNTQLQHSTISHLLGNNVNKCDYWCGSFYYLFSPHREAATGAGKHTQNTDRGDPPSHGHWTLARNNTTDMEHWQSWSLFQWGSNFYFWQYFKRAVASLCRCGFCGGQYCWVFLLLQALSFCSDKLNYFSLFFNHGPLGGSPMPGNLKHGLVLSTYSGASDVFWTFYVHVYKNLHETRKKD